MAKNQRLMRFAISTRADWLGHFSAIFQVKQSKITVQVHVDEIGWGGILVDEDPFALLVVSGKIANFSARANPENPDCPLELETFRPADKETPISEPN